MIDEQAIDEMSCIKLNSWRILILSLIASVVTGFSTVSLILIDSYPHTTDACAVLWLLVLLQTAKYGLTLITLISEHITDTMLTDSYATEFLNHLGTTLVICFMASFPTLTLATPGVIMRAASCSMALQTAAGVLFAMDIACLATCMYNNASTLESEIGPDDSLLFLLLP